MAKWVTIGQITKNKNEKGEYKQLVLNKEFLDKAPELIKAAYLDKKGGRRFSLFTPKEGSPDFVEFNVVVKLQDSEG